MPIVSDPRVKVLEAADRLSSEKQPFHRLPKDRQARWRSAFITGNFWEGQGFGYAKSTRTARLGCSTVVGRASRGGFRYGNYLLGGNRQPQPVKLTTRRYNLIQTHQSHSFNLSFVYKAGGEVLEGAKVPSSREASLPFPIVRKGLSGLSSLRWLFAGEVQFRQDTSLVRQFAFWYLPPAP